jgi:hypothetical protein
MRIARSSPGFRGACHREALRASPSASSGYITDSIVKQPSIIARFVRGAPASAQRLFRLPR